MFDRTHDVLVFVHLFVLFDEQVEQIFAERHFVGVFLELVLGNELAGA